MIQILNKEDCCGCNACGDICNHNAITFKTDDEGFWYPIIDKNKCTKCNLCEQVCPIINIDKLKKNDLPQSICYAAEHKNLEIIFDSTSGGLFSALADIMYKDKGFVGGAVFNEDFSVRHFISNNKKDIVKLRSSKYLQSNLEGFFRRVRDLLRDNERVLVCGSPCQMAALRAFLRYKEFENLIIADYICRGINSPKVWRKYLDSFEERYGSPVVYCKAKSKEYGWRNLTQKVILADGRHIYETKNQSNFTKGYLHTGVYCRPSCYNCKFKGYPRISDITLADFWGIEKVDRSMEKDLGTSLVMVNSKKGESFFERVKSRINYVEVPLNKAEVGNPSLNKPLNPPLVDRKEFFEDLDKLSFLQIADKYILQNPRKDKGLKSIIKSGINYFHFGLQLARRIRKITRFNPVALWQCLKYNSMADFRHGNMLIPTPHCIIDISKSAKITKKGIVVLGNKMIYKSSSLETRLFVGESATLHFGPNVQIGYGSDIEVFKNATLVFKGNNSSNIGFTCICGNHIEIGKDVMIGRHVTIRDNNGAHYINRPGYKNSQPVIIGNKAWLCEQCTIMNGVKIGEGAIVGAKSFVISNVPAHTMVSGHPATIVDEDVLWKY